MKFVPVFSFLVVASVLMGFSMAGLPKPTEQHAKQVQQQFPGITVQQLNQGMELYKTHCKGCHFVKNPIRYSEAVWKQQVPAMVNRINKKGKKFISPEQEALILNYVLALGPYATAKSN